MIQALMQNNFQQMGAVNPAFALMVSVRTSSCTSLLTWVVDKRSISWCNLCKHQPSNLPEKRFTTLLSNEEISCLPDESEDILKKNMLDQYMGRPD